MRIVEIILKMKNSKMKKPKKKVETILYMRKIGKLKKNNH